MPKDPAFLFYPNDFDAATKFFTNEQIGVYMRLLIAQFQHGRLTEKQFTFIAPVYDTDIMQKFKRDEDNKIYNERLEVEITKRKAFSESRRKNVQKRYENTTNVDTSVAVMYDHMENENENENINENTIKTPPQKLSGFMAGAEHLSIKLNDVQVGSCIEYLYITKQKRVSDQFVSRLFEIFKVKEFTGKKWYNDEGAVFTHFLNSLKYEKIDDTQVAAPVKSNDKKANDILSLTD
jgi:uncharacterized protein YdaU (DUF1376 family)